MTLAVTMPERPEFDGDFMSTAPVPADSAHSAAAAGAAGAPGGAGTLDC